MYNEEKIVIFDWGGIVESHFDGEYNFRTAKVDILNRLNEKTKLIDPKIIIKKWNECNYDENGKYISEVNNEKDIQKWFERVKLKFDLQCSYEEFYKVYQEESDKIKYYKDVVDFAHSLKDKCKIGILSNLAPIDKQRIDNHYDLSKFDFVWLSFELNCRKPNEKIYSIVEENLKIPKENILFIDDTAQNINVAKKRGWKVCLATGLELDKMKESVYEFLDGVENEIF